MNNGRFKLHPIACQPQLHVQRHFSHGCLTGQHLAESLVIVTIERHSWFQSFGHFQRKKSVSLGSIYPKAHQFAVGIDKAKPVAVGKTSRSSHVKRVATQLLHTPNMLAHSLRRIKRGDALLPSVGKIVGIAAVKSLFKAGLEGIFHLAKRCTTVALRIFSHQLVQLLTVSRHNILNVGHVFESPFNLKRSGTCLCQFLQMVYLAKVFHRKQVALAFDNLARCIYQVELHAAELCASTTIGTARKTMLRHIAHARIANTQCAVHKDFKLGLRQLLVYAPYLVYGKLSRQNHAFKAMLQQPIHLFGRTVIGLCAGVQSYWGHLHFK